MISAPPTVQDYLNLISSEHRDKPKFVAKVTGEVQPYVDLMATLWSMIGMFQPNAIGDQLDKVAAWVGTMRDLNAPLAGVYFTLDGGAGLDQGIWLGPNDSPSGLTVLPDDAFQTLVKLVIAQNNWDGTIPGAYTLWQSVFGSEFPILIQDNQDMTMLVVFPNGIQSVVIQALITDGYFNLRPAGVPISEFAQPSIIGTPCFGLDGESGVIAGLDTGCWIEPIS